VFGLSYVITTLGVPRSDALSALMLAFVVELFTIVGFATLSDRIGRRPVYLFGALAGIAWAFPFFWLVGTKEWIWIAVAFIGASAVVTAAMFGPQAAYFAELFPPQRRFAGFAFARELGSLLAGGPAPFAAAALVAWSESWWPGRMLRSLPRGVHRVCDLERSRDLRGEHHRRQYIRRPDQYGDGRAAARHVASTRPRRRSRRRGGGGLHQRCTRPRPGQRLLSSRGSVRYRSR
jgi:hypothetical protein